MSWQSARLSLQTSEHVSLSTGHVERFIRPGDFLLADLQTSEHASVSTGSLERFIRPAACLFKDISKGLQMPHCSIKVESAQREPMQY
jgi:hypothetical protein